MQFHWLNKQDNEKLIVFFTGWSFDFKPFEFLKCEDINVLLIYNYNTVTSNEYDKIDKNINSYKYKTLITWSMGVYAAYELKKYFKDYNNKIAINGTPFPVDDKFGIPEKPFLLTLKHAKTGLEGKFYQNIFDNPEEYKIYMKNPVERSIENRIDELNEIYKRIKTTPKNYEKFYDKAIISLNDKIIPTKNQINFWENFKTPYKTIESGHFPYYNFNSWKELL